MNDGQKMLLKVTVSFVAIMAVFILIIKREPREAFHPGQPAAEKAVMECVTSYGLENVKLTVGYDDRYNWFTIIIDSTNYDELSNTKKLELDEMLSDASNDFFIDAYTCNGDKYEVSNFERTILKNGERVYGRYHNSEAYKENKNKIANKESSDIADDYKATCWVLAMNAVKEKLKAPSSAKFPFSYGSDGVSITKSGEVYTVKGWVEAQNSFGAMIKNNFTVTMKKKGDSFVAQTCTIYE